MRRAAAEYGRRGPAARKRVTITCEVCGKQEPDMYEGARFCSPNCRAKAAYRRRKRANSGELERGR